jgi:hypothetical protein
MGLHIGEHMEAHDVPLSLKRLHQDYYHWACPPAVADFRRGGGRRALHAICGDQGPWAEVAIGLGDMGNLCLLCLSRAIAATSGELD